MEAEPPTSDSPRRGFRWCSFTTDRLLLILLVVETFILACARLRWFGIYEGDVWTAWFAIAGVAIAAGFYSIRPFLRGRRWYQFSLRSLLLFTLICAIASAWMAHRIEQKHKEQEAVDALVRKGALVTFDYQFQEFGGFNPTAQPPGPEWLRRLVGSNFFGEVKGVEFPYRIGQPKVTDADLVHLRPLSNLKSLVLRTTDISDAGLAIVEGMTSLRALDLSETSLSDAGLVHLKGLTALTWLDLRRTNVTDVGRAELERTLPTASCNAELESVRLSSWSIIQQCRTSPHPAAASSSDCGR